MPIHSIPRPAQRQSVARRFVLIAALGVAAITVAACSGAGAATSPTGGVAAAGSPSTASGAGPTRTPGTLASSGRAANASGSPAASAVAGSSSGTLQLPVGFRPSGALIRVANLYRSVAATATGAVDVYGTYGTADNDTPLVTVPYGTISGWFDPGILDDARNAQITFFPHGVHASGDEIGSQGETLKGTERITIMLAASEGTNTSGQSLGTWRVVFETSTVNPLPTPPAGQALVELDALALPAFPGVTADYVYLGTGAACLPSMDGGDGPQLLSANRRTTSIIPFAIPAGPQVLTFHLDSADCHGKGVSDGIPVQLAAGQRAYVLLYSPDAKALRSLVVAIEP